MNTQVNLLPPAPAILHGRANHAEPQTQLQVDKNKLLDEVLNKSVGATAQPNQLDFSPKAVADRILGFVTNTIGLRASNSEEASEMLAAARKGVEQGIEEARYILEAMSQLSDEVNATIDETADLIFQGLDDLQASFDSGGKGDNSLQISPEAQLISAAGSIDSRYQQDSSAVIEIVTQDGDKVKINYTAFTQDASSTRYESDQENTAFSYASSNASNVKFQFSVQGELDAGEQQAISALLNEVGELANQFFSGDVQAAFNSAMELGFDANELKSMALDFKQSTYVEVVQTYQQTAIQPSNQPSNQALQNPAPAINVLSQLQDLMEQVREMALIEQPENTLKSLLSELINSVIDKMQPVSPLQNYITNAVKTA